MTKATAARGVYSPVVTPFKADLSPDVERWIAHCKWLRSHDCGLAIFGTNSEANSLSVEERLDLMEAMVDAGIDAAATMPGTGCCSIPESVKLSAAAARLGCAGVLMLPPFYYKGVSDEGLFRHFAEVIERVGDSGLKVYLYHIPPVAQVPITLELIEKLVKAYPDTVVGMKDSSGDWSNTKAVLDAFPDFAVFPGSETFLLDGLRHGGVGCISATANINTPAIVDVYNNWQADDADARQGKLNAVRASVQKFPMIPALKATVARFGEDDGWARVRPPLVELDATQRAALAAELDGHGFTMPGLRATAAA